MAAIHWATVDFLRDASGELVLGNSVYPFTCVRIRLQDKAANPLPFGERMVNSFCFQIEGFGQAASLEPLLVRKVVIGYRRAPKPVMTIEEFESLNEAMVLDYSIQEPVFLPAEASIDGDGYLCWSVTKTDPVVQVWSHVPVLQPPEGGDVHVL